MNIVVLGMPGSGKGTSSKRIANELNMIHLSQGDLLREFIKSKTPYAIEVERTIQKLGYVPNEIASKILIEELDKHSDGLLLDGFPRSMEQYVILENYFIKRNLSINSAIYLDIASETAISRIKQRNRSDDKEQGIQHRIDKFFEYTTPIIDVYRDKGILYTINGEKNPDEVFADTLKYIKNKS